MNQNSFITTEFIDFFEALQIFGEGQFKFKSPNLILSYEEEKIFCSHYHVENYTTMDDAIYRIVGKMVYINLN